MSPRLLRFARVRSHSQTPRVFFLLLLLFCHLFLLSRFPSVALPPSYYELGGKSLGTVDLGNGALVRQVNDVGYGRKLQIKVVCTEGAVSAARAVQGGERGAGTFLPWNLSARISSAPPAAGRFTSQIAPPISPRLPLRLRLMPRRAERARAERCIT